MPERTSRVALAAADSSSAPERESTLALNAARGLAWTVTTSVLTRGVTTAGTLVLANLLGRQTTGEINNAAVLVLSAHVLSLLGVPHFIVTRRLNRAERWHATVLVTATGVVALLAALACVGPLSALLKSPNLSAYLPGLALSTLLTRVALIPERSLQSELRFREVSLARSAADLCFAAVALGLAWAGAGGMSMVWGNVARSVLQLALLLGALPAAEWLTPQPLSKGTFRGMLAFGVPLSLASMLAFAATWWDNLVVSAIFGASVAGAYNLAYKLADLPATQLGEHIGDVLTPSFAHLEPEMRRAALVRATGLLALLVFPLAVGLGTVSSTLFRALFRAEWAAAAPMLTALSALSVVRPIGWTIGSYLQSIGRTRPLLVLALLRAAAIFGSIAVLGTLFGPVAACLGPGIGFGLYSAGAIWVMQREGIPAKAFVRALLPPLLACGPLVVAVLSAREALAAQQPALKLLLEVLAGAVAYLAAAFVLARAAAFELLRVARATLARRSGFSAPERASE